MFFEDGERRIDFILAWNTKPKEKKKVQAENAREMFENNLRVEGLHLEYDRVSAAILIWIGMVMRVWADDEDDVVNGYH